MSPSNSNIAISNGGGSGDSISSTGKNYIEHQVSKRDTLAGVAIKYGVEVGVSLFLNLGFFSPFYFDDLFDFLMIFLMGTAYCVFI